VAGPAVPIFIYSGHGFSVTAQAVFLDHAGVAIGNFDNLMHLTGVISDYIVYTVNRFPKEVPGHIVVRKVALHAGHPFMGSGMEPGFILHL